MKLITLMFILLINCSICYADEGSGVNKVQVESMLQQFKAKGLLKHNEFNLAQQKLNALTPKQWKEIQTKTKQIAKKMSHKNITSSNNIDVAAKSIDVDSPEFKKAQAMLKDVISD